MQPEVAKRLLEAHAACVAIDEFLHGVDFDAFAASRLLHCADQGSRLERKIGCGAGRGGVYAIKGISADCPRFAPPPLSSVVCPPPIAIRFPEQAVESADINIRNLTLSSPGRGEGGTA